MRERSLIPRMAAALLALLGLFDAAYLTLNHYQPSISLVCPVGGGCEIVQTSRWSTIPPDGGVSVALIGLLGYAVLLLLALTTLHRDRLGVIVVPLALLVVASGGLLVSVYLTLVQLVVIRAICFWCVVSAVVETGIVVAAAIDWRAWRRTTAFSRQQTPPRKEIVS